MAFVYDKAMDRSEVAIVDCREFKKAIVARVLIPKRVPFGFHGMWLDGEVLLFRWRVTLSERGVTSYLKPPRCGLYYQRTVFVTQNLAIE